MGGAESKSVEGLEDVQSQLADIRAKEAVLLKKMQVPAPLSRRHVPLLA